MMEGTMKISISMQAQGTKRTR